MSAKGEYMVLLEMGELLDLYPHLTGDWGEDEKLFTQMFEANKEVFNELDVDYEEIGGDD
jgi:hypothetical protein